MSGKFLSSSKGVKDPLEVPEVGVISLETSQRKWASSRLEGRTYWIFSSCSRCSRLTTGTSGTRSGSLRKGQSPCELRGGLSGFLSRRCRGLRPCVESLLEPEDSSPVPTWIFGVLLETPQGSQALSIVVACTCTFLPSCSSSVTLHFAWIKGSVAFPRGFPTRLSDRAVPRATVVCVDPRLETRGSAGKTGFPGMDLDIWGLWEWWDDPGVPLAFPVDSASS